MNTHKLFPVASSETIIEQRLICRFNGSKRVNKKD